MLLWVRRFQRDAHAPTMPLMLNSHAKSRCGGVGWGEVTRFICWCMGLKRAVHYSAERIWQM